MRIILVAAVTILILASAAECEPLHWYKNPKWWAGEAVILTAVALDAHSTCRAFAHGASETNFLLSGSHSCGAVSGVSIVQAGILTGLHAWAGTVNDSEQSRYWRALGYLETPVIAGAMHGYASAHNYSLDLKGESDAQIRRVDSHLRGIGLLAR